jgi:hypothetical protein
MKGGICLLEGKEVVSIQDLGAMRSPLRLVPGIHRYKNAKKEAPGCEGGPQTLARRGGWKHHAETLGRGLGRFGQQSRFMDSLGKGPGAVRDRIHTSNPSLPVRSGAISPCSVTPPLFFQLKGKYHLSYIVLHVFYLYTLLGGHAKIGQRLV